MTGEPSEDVQAAARSSGSGVAGAGLVGAEYYSAAHQQQ